MYILLFVIVYTVQQALKNTSTALVDQNSITILKQLLSKSSHYQVHLKMNLTNYSIFFYSREKLRLILQLMKYSLLNNEYLISCRMTNLLISSVFGTNGDAAIKLSKQTIISQNLRQFQKTENKQLFDYLKSLYSDLSCVVGFTR